MSPLFSSSKGSSWNSGDSSFWASSVAGASSFSRTDSLSLFKETREVTVGGELLEQGLMGEGLLGEALAGEGLLGEELVGD